MKPHKNGSFFRPNRAMSVQPDHPHLIKRAACSVAAPAMGTPSTIVERSSTSQLQARPGRTRYESKASTTHTKFPKAIPLGKCAGRSMVASTNIQRWEPTVAGISPEHIRSAPEQAGLGPDDAVALAETASGRPLPQRDWLAPVLAVALLAMPGRMALSLQEKNDRLAVIETRLPAVEAGPADLMVDLKVGLERALEKRQVLAEKLDKFEHCLAMPQWRPLEFVTPVKARIPAPGPPVPKHRPDPASPGGRAAQCQSAGDRARDGCSETPGR